MKKMHAALVLLLLLLLPLASLSETADGKTGYAIEEIGLKTAFPSDWQVVTPKNVSSHFRYFDQETPELAAEHLRAEGVSAVAFSPSGDAMLRVICREGDETISLYYDIERYTSSMRSDIKNDFLNKAAWALTGYRYSAAEWTNKEGQGRILNLTYTIRFGEETVARGLQAYTIRNGKAFTLDLQVDGGRKLTSQEEKIFAAFVADTVFPESVDMPQFPAGLELTGIVPEETHKAEMTIRGNTTKGAEVSVWILPEDSDDTTLVGKAKANNSGVFKVDAVLPREGDWRLYIKAELEGYVTSEEARWVSYDKRRLPVTFTSLPEGDVDDSQIIISGKTISGVTIQCMEGDTLKKVTTGSGGEFSFKMDRAITGNRKVVLSMTKKDYDNRRFDIEFNRVWSYEDYVKYLSGKVQSLSFKNLSENAEKYLGRLVQYDGEVLDLSSVDQRTYIQLGLKKTDGRWTDRIIAVADGIVVPLQTGDRVSLFVEVTGNTYEFSEVTQEGDELSVLLPSVRLLTYKK